MLKKDIYVLGINLSHDGSACLLKNGNICVAIEKERITRKKHDGGNDKLAVEYCLKAEGITINDLTLVVQNANFEKETLKLNSYYGARAFPTNYNVPVVTISHHLAHAYSTIGTCSFETFNIMIIDGSGSPINQCDDLIKSKVPNIDTILNSPQHFWCEKSSLYLYSMGKLTPLCKEFSPFRHTIPEKKVNMPSIVHSIGGVYQAVSEYCFGDVNDTGKLMGLAPYGNPGVYTKAIFALEGGSFYNTLDWVNDLTQPYTHYQDFKKNFQHYADIARWVQDETERALLYQFSYYQNKFPEQNWAYAGGVALNAVANQRILAETDIKNLYIQPAAGDNGIALGCAYYGWLEVLKQPKIPHNGSTNFGKKYPAPVLHSQSTEECVKIETLNWIEDAAQLLADGKVIGWYMDGCEFGPRALGYRSILAHPGKAGARDYINKEIKNREDFRPFAPAVLREDVTTYFKYDWESPYMILVNPVKEEWIQPLANVVHLNKTARVQTVTKKSNPAFYYLILEFKKRTGLSLLLNTSFNNRGMPIVETPEEALHFFIQSPLDALVMENIIFIKK